MTDSKSTPELSKPVAKTTVTPTPVTAPHPIEQTIPDGAIDPNQLRPGYGPLEGSPKENDPTKLFNPNNPNSPITKPVNPSNPANMPQTQSEKTASEMGIYMALNPVQAPELTKAQQDAVKEKAELTKKIAEAMKEFGGESQIPVSSSYWSDIARLRFLSNP